MVEKDSLNYRDATPFDSSKLHAISDISKALRHKIYGGDTREAMAQQGEALVKMMQETGGNQSAEVIGARGSFDLLQMREDAQDNAIANKFGKTDADRYLSSITVIPETYASLATIQAKYPTGANGLMVAADNGHKYIWTGAAWTDAGIYQSVGIADNSVTPGQIRFINGIQVSLNEFTDLNPIPWQDKGKALSMNFNPVTGYFSATTAATQPNSGMLFQATRKSGPYTLDFWGVNSNMSGNGIYLTDANGTLLFKPGIYFANAKNESQQIRLGENVFDMHGIKIGDRFQILIAISPAESGGKSISGYAQLSRDNEIKKATSLDKQINDMNFAIQKGLYRQDAIVDTRMARWFSDENYQQNDDDSLTYWREGKNDPGPSYRLTQPVVTGETIYVCFQAKKVAGETASLNVQLCNDNVYTAPADGFRLADTVVIKLSNDWETYVVPVTLDSKWSKQDPSTANVILSIAPTSNSLIKVMLRKSAIIHGGSIDNDLNLSTMTEARVGEAIVPELAAGRRKGEFLPADAKESVLPKVHYVSPKATVATDGMYLDSLTVRLKTAENVKFAVGNVDQNNLMIKASEFSLDLPAGTRTIVFKRDIALPAGTRVFMDCHQQGILYQSSSSTEKTLIEDEDHQINSNGYSGYALYESALMAPFSYRVRGQALAETVAEAKGELDGNTDTTDELKRSLNILTAPSGKRFAIAVNDDGSISTTSLTPNKALFYGNSLTIGLDNYGMAASDYQHGWADLVSQAIKKVNPNFTYTSIGGGNWEGMTNSADRLAELNTTVKPALPSDTDLVIIQLSDNVNTDAKKATFAKDAKDMTMWFRQQAPKARIVWLASWFSPSLVPDIKAACKERGAEFCDITQYARPQEYKSYIGAPWTDRQGVKHTIDSAGRAAHPGDLGMKMIANSVLETLGLG